MAQEFRDTKLPKPEIIDGPVKTEGPRYPSLHLPLKFVPEAEKWPMDKDYELTLRVKVSGVTISRHKGREEDSGSVDFDITGIKAGEKSENIEKEKEEKSQGSYRERQ